MMKKMVISLMMVLIMVFSTTFAFAASDPKVVVINPEQYSTIYSENLLISIKVLEPKTIRVAFYEEQELVNDVPEPIDVENITKIEDLLSITDLTSVLVYDKEYFDCNNYLSFYTKRIEDLGPGLYRIKVDTINDEGKVTYSINTHVIIKDKSLEPSADEGIFDEPQQTTMEMLQNFFSNIFGN